MDAEHGEGLLLGQRGWGLGESEAVGESRVGDLEDRVKGGPCSVLRAR